MAENNFDVTLEENVKKYLAAIGFTYSDDDSWMLKFCIEKVTNTIKNECNVSSIPKGLEQIAVQMVVGEFLYNKKNAGQTENFENLDFDAVVKSIQEGDTNITFAIGEGSLTPEQRLNNLITHLMSSGKSEFVTYRKIKW